MRFLLVPLFCLAVFGTVATRAAEIQVNTTVAGPQTRPRVAMGADGTVVAVWESDASSGVDPGALEVRARRFAADGTALGVDFAVDPGTGEPQTQPDVAVDDDGSFVVVWDTRKPGGDQFVQVLMARRFDAAGAPIGDAVEVQVYGDDDFVEPAVAFTTGGAFVIVYEAFSAFLPRSEIRTNFVDATGTPEPGFTSHAFAMDEHRAWHPAIDRDPAGGVLLAWFETIVGRVRGRRLGDDGDPAGAAFGLAEGFRARPDLAIAADGTYLVVWEQHAIGDPASPWIAAQRLSADDDQLGSTFQVNGFDAGAQTEPRVIFDGGVYLALWASEGSAAEPSDPSAVLGRVIDRSGAFLGSEVALGTFGAGRQEAPAIAAGGPDRRRMAVWQSEDPAGGDDDATAIAGVFLGPPFADGFESGDTAAWSASVP